MGTEIFKRHPEDGKGQGAGKVQAAAQVGGPPGHPGKEEGKISDEKEITEEGKEGVEMAKGDHDNVQPVKDQAEEADPRRETGPEGAFLQTETEGNQSHPGDGGEIGARISQGQKKAGEG